VSEFVDECRREWRRLGVPDPVANEMAADLTADLEEAEAEGDSPEDVLGNSAFDPRRFAAAWAVARGVAGAPVPERPRSWRPPVAIALTVLLGLVTVGAGLVLLVGYRGHSFAIAVHRVVVSPPSIRFFAPGPGRTVVPGPPFLGTQMAGVDVHPVAWMLLIVGIVGLGLLAVLYWSPWSGHRRDRRDGGRQTPSWS
jgi:hypothetical protein